MTLTFQRPCHGDGGGCARWHGRGTGAPAHADHVGFGVDRITTAAVGEIEERKSRQTIILTLISILRCAESHPLREQTVREPDNKRYSHFRGRGLPKTGGEIATRPARASCLTGVN